MVNYIIIHGKILLIIEPLLLNVLTKKPIIYLYLMRMIRLMGLV